MRGNSSLRQFWSDASLEVFLWLREVDFGKTCCSQIRSDDADFSLAEKFNDGKRQFIGKYPKR